MTVDEIVAVLGPVDETVVADILKTAATAQELSLAWTWIHADADQSGTPLSLGPAAELVGILESIERDVEP